MFSIRKVGIQQPSPQQSLQGGWTELYCLKKPGFVPLVASLGPRLGCTKLQTLGLSGFYSQTLNPEPKAMWDFRVLRPVA